MRIYDAIRRLIKPSLLFAVGSITMSMTMGSPAHAALFKTWEISSGGFETYTGYDSETDYLNYSYVGIQWSIFWIDTLGEPDGHSSGPGVYGIDVDSTPHAIGISEGVSSWLIAGNANHWKKEWGENWQIFQSSEGCVDSVPNDIIPCP